MTSDTNSLPLKQQLIAALDALPDTATFDDVFELLHFVYGVELGLAQADQGMLIPHEEVKQNLRQWVQ